MDTLCEIPDENLPALATLYEKHVVWAPHVLSLIHTGMRLKNTNKFRDSVSFLSVNEMWREDGTIIVIMKFHCYNIFVFTLDDHCVTLRQALLTTDFTNPQAVFFCVHEKHLPTVEQVAKERNLRLSKAPLPYLIFALNPSKATFALDCPPDVYVKKLDPTLSDKINSVWPHKYPGSENYVSGLIEMNGGYGVFLRSSNEMVAWVVKHCFGHIGVLQTDEKHKKKGYGSLVTRALALEILDEGHWPFGTVYPDNAGSIKLFEKLGFERIGFASYMDIINT
ncbi:uncharacterized protein LOC135124140 [Zophobas morio]|uniref:uncharacterized protein LOC135124140 n=1 Tax=Zophobas morio TaxID=2755281 RepID=UPI0030839F0F